MEGTQRTGLGTYNNEIIGTFVIGDHVRSAIEDLGCITRITSVIQSMQLSLVQNESETYTEKSSGTYLPTY